MIVPLAAFVVYVNRPLSVTTIQHAEVSVVGTEPLITFHVPLPLFEYDDTALPFGAPPNASETMSVPPCVNPNPNGVTPFDAVTVGPLARPSSINDVRAQTLGVLLRDDEKAARRVERDLGRCRGRATERARRIRDRRELTLLETEAGDVARAASVHHVHKTVRDRSR